MSRTHYSNEEVPEGVDLKYTPYGEVILKRIGASHAVAGYLVHDEDCRAPNEDCDHIGKIYTAHRHSSTTHEMQTSMGLDSNWSPDFDLVDTAEIDKLYIERHGEESYDSCGGDPNYAKQWDIIALECWEQGRKAGTIGNPYALWLDVYEHSGIAYSLSGEGTQCRWDTARHGAVWAPDDELLKHIFSFPEEERATQAERICRAEIKEYNSWASGDCYGVVVTTYDLNTEEVEDSDECWGYVGYEYAMEELNSILNNEIKHVPLRKGYQMELTV